MKVYTELRIEGNAEDLTQLFEAFKLIQKCCRVGTCREVNLIVDGDGSADLTFYKKTKSGTWKEFDSASLKLEEKDIHKFYIGE